MIFAAWRGVRGSTESRSRLVPVIVWIALLRCAAELEERAVGTPGVRVEARAGDREHVAVAAAFRAIFRRPPPTARLELDDGR